jgi:hypothetical protein
MLRHDRLQEGFLNLLLEKQEGLFTSPLTFSSLWHIYGECLLESHYFSIKLVNKWRPSPPFCATLICFFGLSSN